MNYAEQIALTLFNRNPFMDASGTADELLDAAFDLMTKEENMYRAASWFRQPDFESDLVSAYASFKL